MSDVTIYHNPKCSKSRQTLALLESRGIDAKVVHYLDQPPSKVELKALLSKLNLSAADIIRRAEQAFEAIDDNADEETLLDAMVSDPILIQRPIVMRGDRACLGRPPENVLSLLDD